MAMGPSPIPQPSASRLASFGLLIGVVLGLTEGWLQLALQTMEWVPGSLFDARVSAGIVPLAAGIYGVAFCGLAILLGMTARHLPRVSAARFTAWGLLFASALALLVVSLSGRLQAYTIVLLALGGAVCGAEPLSRLLASETTRLASRRRVAVLLALALLPMATNAAATRPGRHREPPPGSARNVIVVVLDTVRADHLSLYGYARRTSPALDRLASDGVVFEKAFSASSWTLPAHASILTGLAPSVHGLQRAEQVATPLDEQVPSVAEFFQDHGYRTAAVSANTAYFNHLQFGRGFDHFDDVFYSPGDVVRRTIGGRSLSWLSTRLDLAALAGWFRSRDAANVTQAALDWIQSEPERPFCLFLNYFDAHGPDLAPEPFRSRFLESPEPEFERNALGRRFGSDLTRPELARVVAAYDGAIAYTDSQLARLIDALRTRGLMDRTVVVVTADHGEWFMEHGYVDHAVGLWREEIHVPLVVVGRDRVPRGMRISRPVSNASIPSTVVDLALGDRSHPYPGPSLARYWDDEPAGASEPAPAPSLELVARPESGAEVRGYVSIVSDEWHYIEPLGDFPMVFDWVEDPDERHNLAYTAVGRAALEQIQSLERFPSGRATGAPDVGASPIPADRDQQR